MRLARHFRRLRARWRLHRIEWAAMHRPLEPPPGYEKYHSIEEVFPGYRHKPNKIQNLGQFVTALKNAWKLYRHDFFPDPEIERIEERLEAIKWKKRERAFQKFMQKGEEVTGKGIDKAQEVAANVAAELEDKRPTAERILRHRIGVLKNAVHEFAEGYKEAASGTHNFWGEALYDEDLIREDNRPLRYEVEDHTNQAMGRDPDADPNLCYYKTSS